MPLLTLIYLVVAAIFYHVFKSNRIQDISYPGIAWKLAIFWPALIGVIIYFATFGLAKMAVNYLSSALRKNLKDLTTKDPARQWEDYPGPDPGAIQILKEREKQIASGKTPAYDLADNSHGRLVEAAVNLIIVYMDDKIEAPFNCDADRWAELKGQSYRDQLILAGALIAAEIDRDILAEAMQKATVE